MVALHHLITFLVLGCFYAYGSCSFVDGKSLDGPPGEFGECKGLVRLISPQGMIQEYSEDKKQIKFKAAQAVLVGCGCFRLFEKKHMLGRSFYVNKFGEHSVPLHRVRSLARVDCSDVDESSGDFTSGSFVRMDLEQKRKKTTKFQKSFSHKQGKSDIEDIIAQLELKLKNTIAANEKLTQKLSYEGKLIKLFIGSK